MLKVNPQQLLYYKVYKDYNGCRRQDISIEYNAIYNLMAPLVGPTTSNVDLGYGRIT